MSKKSKNSLFKSVVAEAKKLSPSDRVELAYAVRDVGTKLYRVQVTATWNTTFEVRGVDPVDAAARIFSCGGATELERELVNFDLVQYQEADDTVPASQEAAAS